MNGYGLKTLAFGIAIAAVGGYSSEASALITEPAPITFSFTDNADSATLGSSPYGSVTLTQESADEVQVQVSITNNNFVSNSYFNRNTNYSLLFNLTGVNTSNLTIGGFSSGLFSQGSTPSGAVDNVGSWGYGINCTSAFLGAQCSSLSSLTFDVSDTSGISMADFTANGDNLVFASFIDYPQPDQGYVGALTPSATPLPGALALFGSVLLGGLGAAKWRKRHNRRAISVMA